MLAIGAWMTFALAAAVLPRVAPFGNRAPRTRNAEASPVWHLAGRIELVRCLLAVIALWSCAYPWAHEMPLKEYWELGQWHYRNAVELELPDFVYASAGFGVWRTSIPLLGLCLLSVCAWSARPMRSLGDRRGATIGLGTAVGLHVAVPLLWVWGSCLQYLAAAEPWGTGAWAGTVGLAACASLESVLVTVGLLRAISRRCTSLSHRPDGGDSGGVCMRWRSPPQAG